MSDEVSSNKGRRKGFSRRDFLRSAGVAVPTSLLAAEAKPAKAPARAAAAQATVLGPGRVPITLRINGKPHKLEVEPRVTLINALRDNLQMTGSKRVCNRGGCGACTVIMDGNAVYACSILAIEAQGKAISTIEGLSVGGRLHPLQTAFVNADAHQCGMCTPAFVMASKAFLDKHPNPTREQIRRGLGGNICRCGVYTGVENAVLQAAKTAVKPAAKGGSNA